MEQKVARILQEELKTSFPEFENVSNTIKKEIEQLVEEDPQIIIDSFRNLIRENQNITTLAFKHKKINKTPEKLPDKLEAISVYWEIYNFLEFPAYLLSKKRLYLNNADDADKIFKYFQDFNFSSNYKEKARLIRNASSHKIKINKAGNGILILEKKNETEISFSEIDFIYLRLSNIYKWWWENFLCLLFSVPKFGFLALFGVVSEIRTNSENYSGLLELIDKEAPGFFSKTEISTITRNNSFSQKVKKSWQVLKTKIYSFLFPGSVMFVKDFASIILFQAFIYVFERLESIANDILSDSKIHREDQEKIKEIISWLNKTKANFCSIIEEIKNNTTVAGN